MGGVSMMFNDLETIYDIYFSFIIIFLFLLLVFYILFLHFNLLLFEIIIKTSGIDENTSSDIEAEAMSCL